MSTSTVLGLPACSCQVAWFPPFLAELKARDLIESDADLGVVQLIGDAAASAKVHTKGGCADWRNADVRIATVAREMGAPATWLRTTGSFVDNKHCHSGLRGCPHMAAGGLAQIAEVDKGGDGLVGTVPDDPRLKPFLNTRTWQEGIAWHREQARLRAIERLNGRIDEAIVARDAAAAEREKQSAKIKRLRAERDALRSAS